MGSSNTSGESEPASLGMFSPRFNANFNRSNGNTQLSKLFLGPNGRHSCRRNSLLRFLTRNGPRTEDSGIRCFSASAMTRTLKIRATRAISGGNRQHNFVASYKVTVPFDRFFKRSDREGVGSVLEV